LFKPAAWCTTDERPHKNVMFHCTKHNNRWKSQLKHAKMVKNSEHPIRAIPGVAVFVQPHRLLRSILILVPVIYATTMY
jgi:hypothetical protein